MSIASQRIPVAPQPDRLFHAEPLYPLPVLGDLTSKGLDALYSTQDAIAFWCCKRRESPPGGCRGCTWASVAERLYDAVDAEIQTRPVHKAAVAQVAKRLREARR